MRFINEVPKTDIALAYPFVVGEGFLFFKKKRDLMVFKNIKHRVFRITA